MKKLFIIFFLVFSSIMFCNETSEKGLQLIKHYESLFLKTYYCPAHVLTIGWGHTGKDVSWGLIINENKAIILLKGDLKVFETYLNKNTKRILLQHEYDALVDFTYNVGFKIDGIFRDAVNRGDIKLITFFLSKYIYARVKGRETILKGLQYRRNSEITLYVKNLVIFYN